VQNYSKSMAITLGKLKKYTRKTQCAHLNMLINIPMKLVDSSSSTFTHDTTFWNLSMVLAQVITILWQVNSAFWNFSIIQDKMLFSKVIPTLTRCLHKSSLYLNKLTYHLHRLPSYAGSCHYCLWSANQTGAILNGNDIN
jgi:hypothetical protein